MWQQFIIRTRYIKKKMTVENLRRRLIFRAIFSTFETFNFVPSKVIRSITKDIHAETNFSGELSDITIFMSYVFIMGDHASGHHGDLI